MICITPERCSGVIFGKKPPFHAYFDENKWILCDMNGPGTMFRVRFMDKTAFSRTNTAIFARLLTKTLQITAPVFCIFPKNEIFH